MNWDRHWKAKLLPVGISTIPFQVDAVKAVVVNLTFLSLRSYRIKLSEELGLKFCICSVVQFLPAFAQFFHLYYGFTYQSLKDIVTLFKPFKKVWNLSCWESIQKCTLFIKQIQFWSLESKKWVITSVLKIAIRELKMPSSLKSV